MERNRTTQKPEQLWESFVPWGYPHVSSRSNSREMGNTIYILPELHLPLKFPQIILIKYSVELLFTAVFTNSSINISRQVCISTSRI